MDTQRLSASAPELSERLRARLAHAPSGTSALRWSVDDVEGVVIDLFVDVAMVHLFDERLAAQVPELVKLISAAAPLRAVYVKDHPRHAREADVSPLPAHGVPVAPFVAREADVGFEIRPDNGLSVGLYLDASLARAWVRRHAAGRTVLNLFAYTCGFGLVAALGGATRAVNVDASRKVLDWGQNNYRHNGLEPAPRDFISGDAFDWLARFAKKGERFDLVVLDPPGFATTKRSRFSAARDYHRLVKAAEAVRSPAGTLLALCNVVSMSQREFEAQLRQGAPSLRVAETFTQEAVKCAVLVDPASRSG